MLASLHHGIGLSDAQVNSRGVDGLLALGARIVFLSKLEMLLEEAHRLLDQTFLVVKETKFESSISLGLSLVLSFSDVH